MNFHRLRSSTHALSFAPAFVAALAGLSCSTPEATPPPNERAVTPFDTRLLAIASEYRGWACVYRDPHWSPALCRTPFPTGTWMSVSSDDSTHGHKLYDLFVRDRSAYRALGGEDTLGAGVGTSAHSLPGDNDAAALWGTVSPIGQALVKESWRPVECLPTDSSAITSMGKAYRKGEQADLFIMFKVGPATPDTDQGWVYGTVTPDRATVTSGGRVASCMDCHAKAPHDRLFGMLPAK